MKDETLLPHLRHLMTLPDKAAAESELDLPSASDEYQAFGRVNTKPHFAIHFIKPDGTITSFQYVHLDSGSRFERESIHLQFLGLRAVEVTVKGRNLRKLYDYIHQHRVPWVMEVAKERDFVPDGQAVVTSVVFSSVSD